MITFQVIITLLGVILLFQVKIGAYITFTF